MTNWLSNKRFSYQEIIRKKHSEMYVGAKFAILEVAWFPGLRRKTCGPGYTGSCFFFFSFIKLKWYLVKNLVKIWIWLNSHNMMVDIMLNQDIILDFRKCQHILSICYLKYLIWISVCTFIFQNGHVMTSPANQQQEASLA